MRLADHNPLNTVCGRGSAPYGSSHASPYQGVDARIEAVGAVVDAVPVIRRLLAHPRLAVPICAIALLLKILVPAGYMISNEPSGLAITVCSGMAAMPGMSMPGDRSHQGKSEEHGKAGVPCPFAGLSAHALAAIDPVLLVELFAFIMAAGVGAVGIAASSGRTWLRPPLRAPPAHP